MTDSLWDYALAVYRRPGVERACLALQANLGVDVNLLLFCCWMGARRAHAIDEAGLVRARQAVRRWQDEVVRPLRAARTQLKMELSDLPLESLAEAARRLRGQIAAHELEAERIELAVLAHLAEGLGAGGPGSAGAPAAAAANLVGYLALLERAPGPGDWAALATLLAGAFPEETVESARAGLAQALRNGAATPG
jgi:uncharacterized protein (TIGR02444 family)